MKTREKQRVMLASVAAASLAVGGCRTTERVAYKTGEVAEKTVHGTGHVIHKVGSGVAHVGEKIEDHTD